MRIVNEYEREIIIPLLSNEDKKIFRDVAAAVKYPELKVQGEALGRVVGRLRIECFTEMAKTFNFTDIINETTKKTVIFSNYIVVCETAVANTAKKHRPIKVYGDESKNITKTVKRFHDVPNLNPLVATYASLSTAVPLTIADRVIFIDSPFRGYILDQAISRLHRLGADTQVIAYFLELDTGAEVNLSSRTLDILVLTNTAAAEISGLTAVLSTDELDRL